MSPTSSGCHHEDMRVEAIVIGVLGVLGLGAAVAAIAAWGGRPYARAKARAGEGEVERADDGRTIGDDVRWWLQLVAVHLLAGLVGGVLVAGLGGRLAMRLIAATSGRPAQGKLTEADEVVGAITLDGTIGFLIFVGLAGGVVAALLYLVVRPVLPAGRASGLLFGAFLLVVAATRLDPLRADNPDFDIVGPDLVSIAIFGVLPVLLGMTVSALAARFSGAVPMLTRSPRTWPAYIGLVPAMLAGPVGAAIVLAGAIAISGRRVLANRTVPAAMLAMRVALAAIALVALPGFVVAIADIARG